MGANSKTGALNQIDEYLNPLFDEVVEPAEDVHPVVQLLLGLKDIVGSTEIPFQIAILEQKE